MATYKATIGMEIHAELKTRTKMFCNSANNPDEERLNVNICPVCLAHPGTLPVINREAVSYVLRVGAALGGSLADYTEFDRKNYFYPDLPKGYQISQYEFPLVTGGSLGGVAITRVHLEEDTASSVHSEATGETLIDFNRAGVPLMELVTDPVISSAEEAGAFGRELQLLLRYLGVSEANMEKGQMRVEANISVSTTSELGTKVEVKNLNSFRSMERAVEYEIRRQSQLLEKGEKVIQETRGWDDGKQSTFVQRVKEGSADYRYFPDPDLPSLRLSLLPGFTLDEISHQLPELPAARRARYITLGLKAEDAESFVRDERLGKFFEEVIGLLGSNKKRVTLAGNYIANDLVKLLRDIQGRDSEISHISVSSSNFSALVTMIDEGKISSRGAKDILEEMFKADRKPDEIAKEKGLFQKNAEDAGDIIKAVIVQNPGVVEQYKAGKTSVLEFLVGQAMKALRGAGNPAMLREAIKKELQP
jgi:aspartyl-tRNA(Asn)/glutamyl-tRNA(Gln) amidotransferase subunit B